MFSGMARFRQRSRGRQQQFGRQVHRQEGAQADLDSRPVEEALLLGRLEEHIRKARADIRALAEGRKDIVQLGGMEAVAAKINLASLDGDSNGKLSPEEYARFTEVGGRAVDRIITMCHNAVMVSALILSIVFTVAFQPIQASDETIEFFGGSNASSAVSALYALHDICLVLTIASNVALLVLSLAVLDILLAWIPQLDAQQCWCIENVESLLYIQVVLPFALLWLLVILPVPAGLLLSPRKGLIFLFLPVSFTLVSAFVIMHYQGHARSMQLVQARQLFGMKTDDIPRRVLNDSILVNRRKAQLSCARVQCA